MNLIAIIISVTVLVAIAYFRTPNEQNSSSTSTTTIEILPPTRVVEVEIIDEMMKEKIRNLYEEQDICNARILHLMKQNKEYRYDISKFEEKIRENLDSMRTQLMIKPDLNINILKASYEESNRNINKHILKLEGMILTNEEKIISLKKKSNSINEQITKIGKEVYEKQRQSR